MRDVPSQPRKPPRIVTHYERGSGGDAAVIHFVATLLTLG